MFRRITEEINQKYSENDVFFDRNLIICSSHASRLVDSLFGFQYKFQKIKKQMNGKIISGFVRKLIELMSGKYIIHGRMHDSISSFEIAIDLGSLVARADLAFLCIKQQLAYNVLKRAFQLVKEGHEFGCRDCEGMIAYYYTTGGRGVVTRCDETAYSLACDSADAGSLFGKMALAHFLKSLLGPIDPDEETFYVLWTDQFIRNFAIPVEDEDDENILMEFDKRRIAKLLIAEIQQEHALNPNIPKVWLNLPAI
jgi:hypothetical protein